MWRALEGLHAEGKTASIDFGGAVSPLDIAIIWKHATEGLTGGHLPGGATTCVAAVTVALGECGHPAQSEWRSIHDKVCTKDASGAGGLWQVTSQDGDDTMLAGCTDGFDFCCNARIACKRTLAPARPTRPYYRLLQVVTNWTQYTVRPPGKAEPTAESLPEQPDTM